jgi:hypothetical protein
MSMAQKMHRSSYSHTLNILSYDLVALEISPYKFGFEIYVIRVNEGIREALFD